MCWFIDWVTLLSARCKYKMIRNDSYAQGKFCNLEKYMVQKQYHET